MNLCLVLLLRVFFETSTPVSVDSADVDKTYGSFRFYATQFLAFRRVIPYTQRAQKTRFLERTPRGATIALGATFALGTVAAGHWTSPRSDGRSIFPARLGSAPLQRTWLA